MWNEKGNSHLQQPILPSLFSIGAIGLTLAGALIWQSEFAYALDYVSSYVDGLLRWWYVALVAFLTAFVIWLGLGRYKNVRLGKDYEQPEYRLFPWLAMLFAAGTGVGLLFWSIAEPIMHFQGNPFTSEGFTPSAASTAIQLSFFHWGLNGWAIFALVAIAFGYFSYRHDLPLAPRSALYPFIGERIFGFWGHVVDALAVFATVFGLATTLGLGARQTGTGLKWLFSVEASLWVELSVVDEGGNVVFSSGTRDEGHFIEPGSFLFKAEPVDQYGNLIDRHNLWEMVGVRFRRALFPGYSDAVTYDIACPADLSAATAGPAARHSETEHQVGIPAATPGGTYRVTAKLFYRKVDQFLLNYLLGEDSGITAPVIEMTRATAAVEIAGPDQTSPSPTLTAAGG